jgi:hypothetical protein
LRLVGGLFARTSDADTEGLRLVGDRVAKTMDGDATSLRLLLDGSVAMTFKADGSERLGHGGLGIRYGQKQFVRCLSGTFEETEGASREGANASFPGGRGRPR